MSSLSDGLNAASERSKISRSSGVSLRAALIVGLCVIASAHLLYRMDRSERAGVPRSPALVNPTINAPLSTQPAKRPAAEIPPSDGMTGLGKPAWRSSVLGAPVIEYKYRYLLADIRAQGQDVSGVLELLQQREQVLADDATIESVDEGTKIDDQLRRHLHAADYATYELLRDSDEEQRQFDAYAGGLVHVAPLDDMQERAVLEAKLRYNLKYRALLDSSGFDRAALSAAERTFAFETAAAARYEYHHASLQDARVILGDDQFAALSDYESTELERELARLQSLLNERLVEQ